MSNQGLRQVGRLQNPSGARDAMSIDWSNLDQQETHDVPARPEGRVWTMVRTQISAPAVIRIEASGTWHVANGLPECGPDGLRQWYYGRELLLTKKAPLGALIGKLGGSIGSVDEAEIFVVGSATVLQIEKATGPLYLTINGAPAMFAAHMGSLTIKLG
jgi:hypothetical protein